MTQLQKKTLHKRGIFYKIPKDRRQKYLRFVSKLFEPNKMTVGQGNLSFLKDIYVVGNKIITKGLFAQNSL